jgi:nitrogen fixation protein NifB
MLVNNQGFKKEVEYPDFIKTKTFSHPCYSESACAIFGRVHLPVAKNCNIQCGYCNRKYDCLNESRPGVTSKVISPEEALRVVDIIVKKIPQTSVIGIAGPGDPLANAESTFKTIRLIREKYPKLNYCISTNGLTLPEYVDQIVSSGIEFLTVTVNAIDPKIAAQIYKWVNFKGQIIRGESATSLLINNQLSGIQQLASKGVLVKVNTVCIPGLNWDHIATIAKTVKEKGAILYNPMPIIPVSGTQFEFVSPVNKLQLKLKQKELASIIKVMKHCHHCRADAVGRLQDNLILTDIL